MRTWQRELHFDEGMPDKPGGKAFPKGSISRPNFRSSSPNGLNSRKCVLSTIVRGEYEYAKEKTLVKMVMKDLQHTEYAKTMKELLQEMKVDRMIKRRIDDGGSLNESDEVDIDDGEHRNYKDTWLPSFERLKLKLISHYKERNFQSSQDREGEKSKSLPTMVSKIIDGR